MNLPKVKTDVVPIFPLPSVVFFPKTFLPLHIFESRYRQMVEDAVNGSNRIAMALLKDGWENDYFGNPEVHSVGCVGEIQLSEKLADGKYNIMLYGLSRVKIVRFVQDNPYRIAEVKYLEDFKFDHSVFDESLESVRFVDLVRTYLNEVGIKDLDDLLKLNSQSLEAIVNQCAAFLDLDTLEKQDLLSLDSVETRYDRLRQIIEDKLKVLKIAKNVKYVPEDPRWN
ncbi:MAG: LON peptidase substrate-binding domain-containing protein [bacterium]